jgi:NAD(P)-dependent dehydrogenase (short-subunit alcohol dehydrogenase family)
MSTLAGKTILISGASRGIGLAIALRAAAVGLALGQPSQHGFGVRAKAGRARRGR